MAQMFIVCSCGYEGPPVEIKQDGPRVTVGCPYCEVPRPEPTLAERLRVYKMLKRAEKKE